MNAQFIKSESSSSSSLFFTHELIRKQLAVILNAEMIRSSGLLVRFLEFVVEETLQGRQHEVKEYTIGVEVCKRPVSFNPQIDAIVRINAGRLRRLLKNYYAGPGQFDEVRIDIPRGTYVPVFEPLQNTAEIAEALEIKSNRLPHGLTIEILPFINDSPDGSQQYFVEGMAAQLCSSVASIHEFSVVAYNAKSRGVEREIGRSDKPVLAHYLIAGNVWFTSTHFRLSIQLIFTEDSTLVWTDTYERLLNSSDLYSLQKDVISEVVTSIGSLNGVLLKHLCQIPATVRSKIVGEYDALFWFYNYRRIYTVDALLQARDAIEESLKLTPQYATAWAVLSHIYLDSYLMQVSWVEHPLEDALEFAERSLEINSSCHEGYFAIAYAKLLLNKKGDALRAIHRAVSITPLSVGHAGQAGGLLITAGEYDEGLKYLVQTLKANAYCTWYVDVCFSMYHFKRKEYSIAAELAGTVNNHDSPWGAILQCAALGKMKSPEVVEVVRNLEKRNPGIRNDVRKFMSVILQDADLVNDLNDGLELAFNYNDN